MNAYLLVLQNLERKMRISSFVLSFVDFQIRLWSHKLKLKWTIARLNDVQVHVYHVSTFNIIECYTPKVIEFWCSVRRKRCALQYNPKSQFIATMENYWTLVMQSIKIFRSCIQPLSTTCVIAHNTFTYKIFTFEIHWTRT